MSQAVDPQSSKLKFEQLVAEVNQYTKQWKELADRENSEKPAEINEAIEAIQLQCQKFSKEQELPKELLLNAEYEANRAIKWLQGKGGSYRVTDLFCYYVWGNSYLQKPREEAKEEDGFIHVEPEKGELVKNNPEFKNLVRSFIMDPEGLKDSVKLEQFLKYFQQFMKETNRDYNVAPIEVALKFLAHHDCKTRLSAPGLSEAGRDEIRKECKARDDRRREIVAHK